MTNQFTEIKTIADEEMLAASAGIFFPQPPVGAAGRIRRTDAAVALTEPHNQLRDDGPALGCCWPARSWWPA